MVAITPIIEATFEHVLLVYVTLIASILISIPLVFISVYSKRLSNIVINFCNLVQAVPSFAVVAMIVPIIGIGFVPALIAILLRSLLPIVKNTYIGLTSIDPSILDYATGMGLNKWQIFKFVRLPHAYPSIFAGIKFAAILANSIAVLTAFIGSGGLGEIIFQGLIGYNTTKLLSGAIPAIVLALFIDFSFTSLEKSIDKKY